MDLFRIDVAFMSFRPFKCSPGSMVMANRPISLFTKEHQSTQREGKSPVYIRRLLVYLEAGPRSRRTVQGSIWSKVIVKALAQGFSVGLKETFAIEFNSFGSKLRSRHTSLR